MKDYIITFDLETTGRNIEKDKICWICLKKINKNTKMIEEVFNRYVNPNWKPFETNARYFSDFIKDREWFLNL